MKKIFSFFIAALIVVQFSLAFSQTKYSATTINCSNTTTETNIYTVTVPMNTWADGDVLNTLLRCITKNSSGSTKTLTLNVKVNGTPFTVFNGGISSNAAEGQTYRGFEFVRVGNILELLTPSVTAVCGAPNSVVSSGVTTVAVVNTFTGIDFTSDVTIELSAQWSAASANTYFNCSFGYGYKW